MKKLLAAIILAAALWSGHWIWQSQMLETALTDWFDTQRATGHVADYSALDIEGFPNRHDVTLTDLNLAAPEAELAWSAPFLSILMLSYDHSRAILVFPERQTVATPERKWRIDSEGLRLSWRAAEAGGIARVQAEGRALRVAPDTGPTWAAETLTAALMRNPDAPEKMRAGLTLKGLSLPQAGGPDLPPLAQVHLDAQLTLAEPWDQIDLPPRLTALDLTEITLNWGEMRLRSAGKVTLDTDGWATGKLTLRLEDWHSPIAALVASGTLPDWAAQLLNETLSMAARFSPDPNKLDVPLTFRGRKTWLGPVPLGPAPRL